MENKYYTPEISEFHVGFEYEKYDDRIATYRENNYIPTNWHRFKYDLKSIRLSQIGTHLYSKTIRVKYLDQSDIESLGWESDQYVPERNICLNFKKPNDWYLNYWFGQTPYIEISRDGYDTGCALYVKNKSELIKLQQQLNIK